MRSTLGFAAALVLAAMSPSYAADQLPAGISGVKIAVKDTQKAVDFYTVLGMKLGVKYHPTEQEMLSGNSQPPRIILIHDGTSKQSFGRTSLMVNVADAQATAKALRDAGYPGVGEPKITARAVVLTVQDPDGDTIELISPAPAQ